MLTDHTNWNLIQFLSKLKNRIVRVCELCVHVCVYVCGHVSVCEYVRKILLKRNVKNSLYKIYYRIISLFMSLVCTLHFVCHSSILCMNLKEINISYDGTRHSKLT